MEIASITEAEWVRLSELVAHLWIFAAALVGAGASYIVAHGLIPSLALTGDVDSHIARRLRMPIYAFAAFSFTAAVAIAVKAVLLALDILPEIFPRMII